MLTWDARDEGRAAERKAWTKQSPYGSLFRFGVRTHVSYRSRGPEIIEEVRKASPYCLGFAATEFTEEDPDLGCCRVCHISSMRLSGIGIAELRVASLRDLHGRRIGVPEQTIARSRLVNLQGQVGTLKFDVIEYANDADLAMALMAGGIELAVAWEPAITRLELLLNKRLHASAFRRVDSKIFESVPLCGAVVINAREIDPRALRIYLEQLDRACVFIEQHRKNPEFVKDWLRRLGEDQPDFFGQLTRESLQNTLDVTRFAVTDLNKRVILRLWERSEREAFEGAKSGGK